MARGYLEIQLPDKEKKYAVTFRTVFQRCLLIAVAGFTFSQDLGAVCTENGATSTLRSTIAGANGTTVPIGQGTYTICSPLTISHSGVRVVGEGVGVVRIRREWTTLTSGAVFEVHGASDAQLTDVTIAGLTIDLGSNFMSCSDSWSTSGLDIVNTLWVTLLDIQIASRSGCPSVSGQTGLLLRGVGNVT